MDVVTVGILVETVVLAAATIYLLWKGRRDGPTLVMAGFGLGAVVSTAALLLSGMLVPVLDLETAFWFPLFGFGLGFSCLFAFTVLYGRRQLDTTRRVLLVACFAPAVITVASFLAGRGTLVRPGGGLTEAGHLVFYIPEALGALIPLFYFASKWYASVPGAARRRYMWLVLPFAFWAVHDGLLNVWFVHLWPERYPFPAGYPGYLIPLNAFRLVVAATLGILAFKRSRSPQGSREDRYIALFVLASFALSFLQIWGWGIHVFLNLLLFLLILYAFARYEVLDIDLKVKWTIHRGTALSALAIVFFVVKEGIEALLPLEGLLPSILGAAAIGLLLFPAWRLAGRLADGLMPGVQDTDEYHTVRKREVYRATLESVLEDGEVTDKERSALATLADQLGLSTKEALDLEREVASTRGVD